MAPHTWWRFFFRILALRSSHMEHGLPSRLLALILLKSSWNGARIYQKETVGLFQCNLQGWRERLRFCNGKAKHDKSGTCGFNFQESLISHVSACISRMLGDHTGRQVDSRWRKNVWTQSSWGAEIQHITQESYVLRIPSPDSSIPSLQGLIHEHADVVLDHEIELMFCRTC